VVARLFVLVHLERWLFGVESQRKTDFSSLDRWPIYSTISLLWRSWLASSSMFECPVFFYYSSYAIFSSTVMNGYPVLTGSGVWWSSLVVPGSCGLVHVRASTIGTLRWALGEKILAVTLESRPNQGIRLASMSMFAPALPLLFLACSPSGGLIHAFI
jgi:hypothetical protein